MERVYPKLKQLCQENGYEFQVKDMCWGVRDAAVDDHVTTEVCLRELRACLKTSTGPSFVVRLESDSSEIVLETQIASNSVMMSRFFWQHQNETGEDFAGIQEEYSTY